MFEMFGFRSAKKIIKYDRIVLIGIGIIEQDDALKISKSEYYKRLKS